MPIKYDRAFSFWRKRGSFSVSDGFFLFLASKKKKRAVIGGIQRGWDTKFFCLSKSYKSIHTESVVSTPILEERDMLSPSEESFRVSQACSDTSSTMEALSCKKEMCTKGQLECSFLPFFPFHSCILRGRFGWTMRMAQRLKNCYQTFIDMEPLSKAFVVTLPLLLLGFLVYHWQMFLCCKY